MRRWLPVIPIVAAVAVAAIVLGSGGGRSYRVTAVFVTAAGLVPGDQVEVAGAPVGSVDSVSLTQTLRAEVGFTVPARFAPFRQGATCTILSEGLISENYVQCAPGASSTPALIERDGTVTVPVTHTSVPVTFQDVLNIFAAPTDDRIQILLDDLGIGLAGRGDDINAILERSNPALTQTGRALGILAQQRSELGAAVSQTDTVLGQLAQRRQGVRAFVDAASTTAATAADHAAALSSGIQDLPSLLDRLQSASVAVGRVAQRTSPVLVNLRSAAPELTHFTEELPQLVQAGRPALQQLSTAARAGRNAVPGAVPVAHELRVLGSHSGTLAAGAKFLGSLQATGGIESVLRLFYAIAGAGSAYDSTSHFLSLFISVSARCLADHTQIGCEHSYSAPAAGEIPFNDPNQIPTSVDNARVAGGDAAGLKAPVGTSDDQPLPPHTLRSLLEYLLK